MTPEEKKFQLLYLLIISSIRRLQVKDFAKFKDNKKKMKITIDMFKFSSKFKNMRLKPNQFEQIMRMFKADIQNHTPKDTGFLQALISYKITGAEKGELFIKEKKYPDKTGTKYGVGSNEVARYQHYGTESHSVKVRDKRNWLTWRDKSGGWHKAKQVEVSGVIATNFFEVSPKALTTARKLMQKYYQQNLGI